MDYYLEKNLNWLLSTRGLTQGEFAKALGALSSSTISGWINGASKPPLNRILQICEYFEISMDDLVCRDLQLNGYKKHAVAKENMKEVRMIVEHSLSPPLQEAFYYLIEALKKQP